MARAARQAVGFVGFILARIRHKHRNGLLRLWAFERLTGVLSQIGVRVHLSVIYREEPLAEGPEPRLSDCSVGFATAHDIAQITTVKAYTISVEELEGRLSRGAECYLCGTAARLWRLPGARREDHLAQGSD